MPDGDRAGRPRAERFGPIIALCPQGWGGCAEPTGTWIAASTASRPARRSTGCGTAVRGRSSTATAPAGVCRGAALPSVRRRSARGWWGGGSGRDAERCPAVPAEWCGPCAGRGAPEAWSRRSWRSASPRAASCWNRSPSAERSAGAGECGGNGAGPGPAVLGSPQRSLFCSSSGCVTEARAVLIRARHLRTTLRRRGAERREWDAQESGGDALYERCRRVALEQGMGAPQHPAPR